MLPPNHVEVYKWISNWNLVGIHWKTRMKLHTHLVCSKASLLVCTAASESTCVIVVTSRLPNQPDDVTTILVGEFTSAVVLLTFKCNISNTEFRHGDGSWREWGYNNYHRLVVFFIICHVHQSNTWKQKKASLYSNQWSEMKYLIPQRVSRRSAKPSWSLRFLCPRLSLQYKPGW